MNSARVLITGGSGFIGTNLIELLRTTDAVLLNLDIAPPMSGNHMIYWREQDVLDINGVLKIFAEFQPTCVIDLAARTDCDENTTVEAGYQLNIDGARNIIRAINASTTVSRAVFTSTQYVKRPGPMPSCDEDCDPHTVYGESKVRMERLIRSLEIPCTWSIIRPTNVWGPWHMRYRKQFFKVLKMGLYFHPAGEDCVKSYAFVGNVVDQICRIIDAPVADVNGKTFYVGDAPLPLLDWVNAFAVALSGRKARVIPSSVVYGLAKIGDVISAVTGRRFLITTSRYNSMTEDYPTPMDKTFDTLGMPCYSLDEGVRRTVEWLDNYDRELAGQPPSIAKKQDIEAPIFRKN